MVLVGKPHSVGSLLDNVHLLSAERDVVSAPRGRVHVVARLLRGEDGLTVGQKCLAVYVWHLVRFHTEKRVIGCSKAHVIDEDPHIRWRPDLDWFGCDGHEFWRHNTLCLGEVLQEVHPDGSEVHPISIQFEVESTFLHLRLKFVLDSKDVDRANDSQVAP
eukprot:CAMPEP_0170180244 /NCGR_PEP_ID=MMETSP0040_2-20121228/21186_1 /TAXON_ID=641309 /ORGANISM="Lotharella oceanica, Strain CCMP622" /LENGTH=160 /DNA_ID=CAMNT_0010424787 /DNA_START=325 /DNA_END=807 /DNA_ORIENTATION=-